MTQQSNNGGGEKMSLELIEYLDGRFNKVEDKIDDFKTSLNGRVSKLERWRSYLLGAWAALATVMAWLYK